MMKSRFDGRPARLGATLTLCCCLIAGPALAADALSPRFSIEGNANFWWLINEQTDYGLTQPTTGDVAAEEAGGFNFKQGRIGFHYLSADDKVELLLRLRLEERTDVIDAYGAYHFADWLGMYVGLMKVPSTAEVLTPDQSLDFVTRSSFGKLVSDYSLSRTPYVSLLMANTSNNRDMGLAFKGDLPGRDQSIFRYHLMIGNGIGGGLYVGGHESSEYFTANNFGDFLYAGRLEFEPVPGLVFGGHYSSNRHDDAVFKDTKTVFDLERESWSADLNLHLPTATRLYAFYGQGNIDDFWAGVNYIYDYQGYGVAAFQGFADNLVEVGVRFDSFTTEFSHDENTTEQQNWTIALNLNPHPNFRLQLDYIDKNTINDFISDKNDNVFIANFQFFFDLNATPGAPTSTPAPEKEQNPLSRL